MCTHMVGWGLVSKLALLKFKVTLTQSSNYINWFVISSESETGSDTLFPPTAQHLFHLYLITESDGAGGRNCSSLLTVPCTFFFFFSPLPQTSPPPISAPPMERDDIMGETMWEGRSREALRWREILPRLKRMYALGDDQMAEAEDRQQKERSNIVVSVAKRDSEALKEGGVGSGLLEWSVGIHTYTEHGSFWAATGSSVTFLEPFRNSSSCEFGTKES